MRHHEFPKAFLVLNVHSTCMKSSIDISIFQATRQTDSLTLFSQQRLSLNLRMILIIEDSISKEE